MSKANPCSTCDGTGFIVRRLFEPRSLAGFRQDAVPCHCRTGVPPAVPVRDGKMAAAHDLTLEVA